jgi:hypothetical protein
MLGKLMQNLPAAPLSQPSSAASVPRPADIFSLTASGEEIFHPRSLQNQEPPRQVMTHKPPPSGFFPAHLLHTPPPGNKGFGWGLREGRLISLSVEEDASLKDILAILKESGITKSHLEWVIAGVPGRRLADGLVEMYFRSVALQMNFRRS